MNLALCPGQFFLICSSIKFYHQTMMWTSPAHWLIDTSPIDKSRKPIFMERIAPPLAARLLDHIVLISSTCFPPVSFRWRKTSGSPC